MLTIPEIENHVEYLSNLGFERFDSEDIPENLIGVYALICDEKCVYVGESKNVLSRLCDNYHHIYRKLSALYDVEIYLIKSSPELHIRAKHEAYIIGNLMPVYWHNSSLLEDFYNNFVGPKLEERKTKSKRISHERTVEEQKRLKRLLENLKGKGNICGKYGSVKTDIEKLGHIYKPVKPKIKNSFKKVLPSQEVLDSLREKSKVSYY